MSIMNIIIIVATIVLYFVLKELIKRSIRKIGTARGVAFRRIKYVGNTISITLFIVALLFCFIILGKEYDDLGVIFSSIFAVIGVSLFAQWSILSNVTASVIIFFLFPYRVGDRITVIDSENTIEGVIEEINLFHIMLISENQAVITIPNSVAFQKYVKVVTKRKLLVN